MLVLVSGLCSPYSNAGVNDLVESVSWTYTRRVLVFYVGGEFGMSGISGCACFVRGWGFELRGISGGVRVVHVGGELEMKVFSSAYATSRPDGSWRPDATSRPDGSSLPTNLQEQKKELQQR